MALLTPPVVVPVDVEDVGGGVTLLHAGEPIAVNRRDRITLAFDAASPGDSTIIITAPPPHKYSTHCGVPMIPTSAFHKAELYCMECGAKLGMFSPMVWEDPGTDEMHALYRKVAAEWDEHVGPGILPDGRKPLNDEEAKANRDARAWLVQREGQSTPQPEEART